MIKFYECLWIWNRDMRYSPAISCRLVFFLNNVFDVEESIYYCLYISSYYNIFIIVFHNPEGFYFSYKLKKKKSAHWTNELLVLSWSVYFCSAFKFIINKHNFSRFFLQKSWRLYIFKISLTIKSDIFSNSSLDFFKCFKNV